MKTLITAAAADTAALTSAQMRRQTRLYRIARALAAGATVTEIAEAEKIGRTTASKTVNSQACRQILMDFVNTEEDAMRALFYRALDVIERGFDARREYATKDGQIKIGGPDHYARLSAVKHFKDFIVAGRPVEKELEHLKQKGLTLEQIMSVLDTAKV